MVGYQWGMNPHATAWRDRIQGFSGEKSILAAESDAGKAFTEYMRGVTRQIEMPTFHMDITLNAPQYFRLLARAEAKPGEDTERFYQAYKDRFDFENKVVFTIMMHSAADICSSTTSKYLQWSGATGKNIRRQNG